jgi:hypothetical protein
VEARAKTAVSANEDVVPASALREAQQRIRELERLLGKKQMEIEVSTPREILVSGVRAGSGARSLRSWSARAPTSR